MLPAKPEIFWILFYYVTFLRVEIFATNGCNIIRKSRQIERIMCFLSTWDC